MMSLKLVTPGVLKTVTRTKIIHYRQVYLNHPSGISFMTLTVDTSGRIYDDFTPCPCCVCLIDFLLPILYYTDIIL
jgi:hypothetical protein